VYWPEMKQWYVGTIDEVENEDCTLTYEDDGKTYKHDTFRAWDWSVLSSPSAPAAAAAAAAALTSSTDAVIQNLGEARKKMSKNNDPLVQSLSESAEAILDGSSKKSLKNKKASQGVEMNWDSQHSHSPGTPVGRPISETTPKRRHQLLEAKIETVKALPKTPKPSFKKPAAPRSASGNSKRMRWTQEEESYLVDGVKKFGKSKWKFILSSYTFRNRTNVNLKDKWRNLCKKYPEYNDY